MRDRFVLFHSKQGGASKKDNKGRSGEQHLEAVNYGHLLLLCILRVDGDNSCKAVYANILEVVG